MFCLSYISADITFPWRYFLSIKGYIGQYFLAHRNQYKVIFSENAKARLKTANDTSYNAAISQSGRSESDILQQLSSVGFKRHLTNNQACNLSKISHLPGAATFSVPGAGKTTEALAFFFLNATDADRLLVVAPKNAFSAWDEQLDACMGDNYGKFVRLRGGEAAIQIALQADPRFMFFMTAIIGIVCKIYYRPNVINQITTSVMSEQKLEVVAQHDIDHPIFRLDLEKKEQFFTLFEYCYTKFYRPGYEFLKTFKEKYNNYSNFTKINNNYTTYVFKQIEFEYRHGIPDNDMAMLDSILYKASDEDFLRNKALLEKYVNVVYVDAASESNVPESVSAEIQERLIAYRTKTYKLNRIKAYEVFKNASCDRIAKFAPTSLEDLKALRCLDEAQITLYGQDIIEIVGQVLNR